MRIYHKWSHWPVMFMALSAVGSLHFSETRRLTDCVSCYARDIFASREDAGRWGWTILLEATWRRCRECTEDFAKWMNKSVSLAMNVNLNTFIINLNLSSAVAVGLKSIIDYKKKTIHWLQFVPTRRILLWIVFNSSILWENVKNAFNYSEVSSCSNKTVHIKCCGSESRKPFLLLLVVTD